MLSTAKQIFQLACGDAEAHDGCKSKKYAGARAGERLKEALIERGIPVSDRNVLIEGVYTSEGEYMQIDYVITSPGEKASVHIYQPKQVLLALEVKKGGFFDSNGVPKLRKNFDRLRDQQVHAACAVLRASKTTTEKRLMRPLATHASHFYEVAVLARLMRSKTPETLTGS